MRRLAAIYLCTLVVGMVTGFVCLNVFAYGGLDANHGWAALTAVADILGIACTAVLAIIAAIAALAEVFG